MAEKIHPNSNQLAGNPKFPATKAQLYNSTRPLYHPQALRTGCRNLRSCCCSCCLWITFIILLLLIIAAAGAGVFYVMYRPHRPSFTVSSLQVVQFNLTSSNESNVLNSRFNLTVTARNPNDEITFVFDSVSVKVDSHGVDVGDGNIPAFVLNKKNVTRLKTVVMATGQVVDDVSELRLELKSKKRLMVAVEFDTKVKVKIGSLKTKKMKIRVVCNGIRFTPPGGKSLATVAATSDVKCDVDVRVKMWRWTINLI